MKNVRGSRWRKRLVLRFPGLVVTRELGKRPKRSSQAPVTGSSGAGFLALFVLGWLMSVGIRKSKLWPWHRKARARWVPAWMIWVGLVVIIVAVVAVV